MKGAEFYFDNFIRATDKDIYIQHLRHTYLLLIHNAYKNKFDRQLTDRISMGTRITVWVTAVALVLAFIIGAIINKDNESNNINTTAVTVTNNESTSGLRTSDSGFSENRRSVISISKSNFTDTTFPQKDSVRGR